ncbi:MULTISPECIES: tail fiber assembly protein [Burkholderia]|uniref:Phage tail protein n=1 Tax=Burkholderia aenigmatica TaxID=2015348 RepID=A0A6J5JKR4_9BURK|nr:MULTISPECIES: tail fiber assembly protein [Burkholderia]CAB3972352.1 hypothetical protein BLA3211_06925 [Burkholderia aenigmatica]
MISHELLIKAIQSKWPQLVHGRDYWVAHPLGKDGQQSDDAFIAEWKCDVELPAISQLLALAETFRPTLAAEKARERRDGLLASTDWTQAADVPQQLKDLWAPYRKALREVPQQQGFPTDVVWPTKPA